MIGIVCGALLLLLGGACQRRPKFDPLEPKRRHGVSFHAAATVPWFGAPMRSLHFLPAAMILGSTRDASGEPFMSTD